MATYRELCPPGTPDSHIQEMIGQCKGDAQRMENVISELWEDYRGHGQDDAWATVSKKTAKKKHVRLVALSFSLSLFPSIFLLCSPCRGGWQ